VTGEHAFESILRIILCNFLECGAKLNARNANEQTPLHLCRTWTAVKLLLDAGANPNDVDLSGQPPFLVAAKAKTLSRKRIIFMLMLQKIQKTFGKVPSKRNLIHG
jgi:ankyrin repeat protein